MKYAFWKYLLPTAQLLFALFCLVYGPHQYRQGVLRDHAWGTSLEYFSQHSPPPIERISIGANFPAFALAYPFRGFTTKIYSYNSDYTLIWISPSNIAFFVGIAVFWYLVGKRLDRMQAPGPAQSPLRIAGPICGLIFGALSGAYAVDILAENWQWHPGRQIGIAGIAWSIALVTYFALRVLNASHGHRRSSDVGPDTADASV